MIDPAEAEGGSRGGYHGNGTPWFCNWFHGMVASLLARTHACTHIRSHALTYTWECASIRTYVSMWASLTRARRCGNTDRADFHVEICVSLSVWREKHYVKGLDLWAPGPDRTDRTVSKDPSKLDIPLNGDEGSRMNRTVATCQPISTIVFESQRTPKKFDEVTSNSTVIIHIM